MYEIVPGFIANCLTMIVVNYIVIQKDPAVLKQFDAVTSNISSDED